MKDLFKILSLLLFSSVAFAQPYEMQKLTASDGEEKELFGENIEIDGEYIFVSADHEGSLMQNGASNTEGAVYVFKIQPDGTWKEIQKIKSPNPYRNLQFGSDIKIVGERALIAAHEDVVAPGGQKLVNAGSVYIYELSDSGMWVLTDKLISPEPRAYSYFGSSVAMSCDYIIVGASFENRDSNGGNQTHEAGAAYVFKLVGDTSWVYTQRLESQHREYMSRFGQEVEMYGSFAAISCTYESTDPCGQNSVEDAGCVYMYALDQSGKWIKTQKLVASDRARNDMFSLDIHLWKDELIVTAPYKVVNKKYIGGAVYYFKRDKNGRWSEKQKIIAPVPTLKDYFGYEASFQGNYLIIGAMYEDEDQNELNSMENAGSAYIYGKNSCGTWTLIQKIVASDRTPGDFFAGFVDISDGYAVAGAKRHDTHGIRDAGAAYVYDLSKLNTSFLKCDESTHTSSTVYSCENIPKVLVAANGDCHQTEVEDSDNPFDIDIFGGGNEGDPEGSGCESPYISVTPNPNSGQFKVKINNYFEIPYTIEVTAPFVGSVYKKAATGQTTEVKLSSTARGVYIVKVSCQCGTGQLPIIVKKQL